MAQTPKRKLGVDAFFGIALSVVVLVHFVCRVPLGLGPWLSLEDARRTPLNALVRGIWDLHPWLDLPTAALLLGFLPVMPFALKRNKPLVQVNSTSSATPRTEANSLSGHTVRGNLLSGGPEALAISPTENCLFVYGLVVDECYEGMYSTTFGLSNGNAGVYGPAISMSDDQKHQQVRNAAVTLVRCAHEFKDRVELTAERGYPPLGWVRFYFLCFDGIRMIERQSSDLEGGRNDFSRLWHATQFLIKELRTTN